MPTRQTYWSRLQQIASDGPHGRLTSHLSDEVEVCITVDDGQAEPLSAGGDEELGKPNPSVPGGLCELSLHRPRTLIVAWFDLYPGHGAEKFAKCIVLTSAAGGDSHLQSSDIAARDDALNEWLEEPRAHSVVMRDASEGTRVHHISRDGARHDLGCCRPRAHCAGPTR